MEDKAHQILNFWFGDLGLADLPTSERTNLWFGEKNAISISEFKNFLSDYNKACSNKLSTWKETPRGRLALIILLDQFTRFLYKNNIKAYSNDKLAQEIALEGLQKNMDKNLTLIERVFFYMPLVHAENIKLQAKAIGLFRNLVSLSMSETTQIYQLFLAYAFAHYKVIEEFGRFPQRNKVLKRSDTNEEIDFLKRF